MPVSTAPLASASERTAANTSHSVSFDCTSGANFLRVSARCPGGGVLSSPQFNGVAMDVAASVGDLYEFTLTLADGLSVDAARNFTCASANYDRIYYVIESYSGVNQTTPYETPHTDSGSTADPSTGSLTCPTDGAIVATVQHEYTAAITALAGDLTEEFGVLSDDRRIASGRRTTTGAIQFDTYAFAWQLIALRLNAAAGGGSSAGAAAHYYRQMQG